NGTIAKPTKAATGAVSNDSSRSEGRNTRASALADASDVSRRGFAHELAPRTNALPMQSKADDANNAASNGANTQPPQHNAANPASIATPAQRPEPAPVQQAATTPAAAHSTV